MQFVMGLSGGLDSTTLLGLLPHLVTFFHLHGSPHLNEGKTVHCCIFDYGSTHGKYEIEAANKVVEYYQEKYPGRVFKHNIDITSVMTLFSSNLLLKCGRPIPEGDYSVENMKQIVVPSRNLIFASIMAGIAESIGAHYIALGMHGGDHPIYPDCRPEFVEALRSVIKLSSEGKVSVLTPFLSISKAGILKIGYSLPVPVPYHLTRSCYKNQPVSCGKCATCRERLQAFAEINKTDPIEYETEN